jgi:hypothetical protein
MQIKIFIILTFFCACQQKTNTAKIEKTEIDTLPTNYLFWLSEIIDSNKINREKGFDLNFTHYHKRQRFSTSIKNNAGQISISLAAPAFYYLSNSSPRAFIRQCDNFDKPYAEVLQQNNTSFLLKKNNSNLTIFSFVHSDSSYRIEPFQYTIHFQEQDKISSRLFCIQGKEKNADLLPEIFDAFIHSLLEIVLADTTENPNVNYLFNLDNQYEKEKKLETTTLIFADYQQQSKWDNYLYVSTHGLGQTEKVIIKDMRKMLNNHFD